MCEYAFYNNINNSKHPQLYCKITNKICLFSKFCTKQNKYIHREGAETCYMALERKINNSQIPLDAYHVRFVRKGYVYVEIENKVEKIKNTLGDKVTDYVYLEKQQDNTYKISLTPFTKKSSKRKKNDKDV